MIIGRTIAKAVAIYVSLHKELPFFARQIAKPGTWKDSSQVPLVIDLPVKPDNWKNDRIRINIDAEAADQIKVVVYFQPGGKTDGDIKRVFRDVSTCVIKAGLKFQDRIKIVSIPIGKHYVAGQAGHGVREETVRPGKIKSLQIESQLQEIVLK